MNTTVPNAPRLVCSKCRAHPTALEEKHTARLGGTHYRRFYRFMPSSGKSLDVARSCGTWVEEQHG